MNSDIYIQIIENAMPSVLAGVFYMHFGSSELDKTMKSIFLYRELPLEIKKTYSMELLPIDKIEHIHKSLGIDLTKLKKEIFLINEITGSIDRGLVFPKEKPKQKLEYIIYRKRVKSKDENEEPGENDFVINILFQRDSLNLILDKVKSYVITIVKDSKMYISFTKEKRPGIAYKMSCFPNNNGYSSNVNKDQNKKIICGEYKLKPTVITNENLEFFELELINPDN